MHIRNYLTGDELTQVDIYNAAAGAFPKFKPANLVEVRRRVRARGFDPKERFYADVRGRVVGYGAVNANGRISFPWCLPGYEEAAPLLFATMLDSAKERGIGKLFAAYRGDWPSMHDFFLKQGFHRAREVVNFVLDLMDMPTITDRANSAVTPLEPADVPALFGFLPQALRVDRPELLHDHLFKNPYFSSDSVFALRNRTGEVMAAGIAVYDPTFADLHTLDAAMPCFRLGAFGTEGMQTKRIKGLFSFLAKPDASLPALALDLASCAANRLRDYDEVNSLAAQSASDVPALLEFYKRHFKQQGSFPVFEKRS